MTSATRRTETREPRKRRPGRPRLQLTDEQRAERVRQQNAERWRRKRQRDRAGEIALTNVVVPSDIAPELPEPDEGDRVAALMSFARRGLFRDLA